MRNCYLQSLSHKIIFTFCFLFFAVGLHAEEVHSTNRAIGFISFGANVSTMGSSRNLFSHFVIGEQISVPVTVLGTSATLDFGYQYYYPSLKGEVKYEIAEHRGSPCHSCCSNPAWSGLGDPGQPIARPGSGV